LSHHRPTAWLTTPATSPGTIGMPSGSIRASGAGNIAHARIAAHAAAKQAGPLPSRCRLRSWSNPAGTLPSRVAPTAS